MIEKIRCADCETEFEPPTPRHRYCSEKCRTRKNNALARARGQGSTPEYAKKWRTENAEKFRATQRANYQRTREARLAAKREAYTSDPERFLAATRKSHAKRPYQTLIASARFRAKRAGIPYDLDSQWAKERWTGRCEMSGIEFKSPDRSGPGPYSATIDRIVPSLGYIKSNCRFILHAINAARCDGTDEDLLMVCRAIIGIRA